MNRTPHDSFMSHELPGVHYIRHTIRSLTSDNGIHIPAATVCDSFCEHQSIASHSVNTSITGPVTPSQSKTQLSLLPFVQELMFKKG